MSLLQRPPIDVHASIGCMRAPEHIYRSATHLLEASQTIRPFAGAIIRSALVRPELTAMLSDDPEERDAGLAEASFLEPLNRAVNQWWETSPLSDECAPGDLVFRRRIPNRESNNHIDQEIDRVTQLPHNGPLTALVVLKGSVDYQLAVWRRNPFNPKNRPYYDGQIATQPPKHAHSLTANTGDLVIFTNTPPTYHRAKERQRRLSAVYFSQFYMTNGVE